MTRYDRKASEDALLAAVDAIINEQGTKGLGVNAIAKRAGVNKALIYRYFESLDGLYKAYAKAYQLWPTPDEVIGDLFTGDDVLPMEDLFVELMMNYAHALRARPRTIALLASECVTRDALTIAFEDVRERASELLFAQVAAATHEPPPEHIYAHAAFISSSIHYLLIRSRDIKVFAGSPIQSDAFWSDTLREFLMLTTRPMQP